MSARLLTPARLQALGMVVIGVLAGFAAASAWNRLASEPTPAESREAEPVDASPPGHTPSE
jgi:hypothetical protein